MRSGTGGGCNVGWAQQHATHLHGYVRDKLEGGETGMDCEDGQGRLSVGRKSQWK